MNKPLSEINEYSNLERGWDGRSAAPIKDEVSEEAKRIAVEEDLPDTEFEIFPTGLGTIQFEFYGSDGREVEFEILGSETGEILLDPDTGTVRDRDGEMGVWEGEIEKCIEIINDFLE